MQQKNIFELFKSCLKPSITYDFKSQSIAINNLRLNYNIDVVLDSIGCPRTKQHDIKQHILLACKNIAKGITFNTEGNSVGVSKAIDKMEASLQYNTHTILRFGYLQSAMYARDNIEKLLISESGFTTEMRDVTEMLYKQLQEKDLKNIVNSFKMLRDIEATLNHKIQDIKTPDLIYEIAIQQDINKHLEYDTCYLLDKIDAQINKIIDDNDIEEKNTIQLLIKHKNDVMIVQKVMQSNNILLSKIQPYFGQEKASLKKVYDYLLKFDAAAAEGIILQALQANDRVLGSKLQALNSAVHKMQLKDLDTIEKIDIYLQSIEEMYSASEIGQAVLKVADIETKISCETEIGKQIKLLPENFTSFKNELIKHKEYIDKNTTAILPIEIDNLQWERSSWESFSSFCASVSKLCIGQGLHCQIFGHVSGVEELRRAAESCYYDNAIVSQIDFEQFKIDIINETF